MTVGVYGLVAGIVKIDDAGLHLQTRTGSSSWVRLQQSIGNFLLWIAPVLMKLLSVLGTAAMFLVGGGILVHGWPWLVQLVQQFVAPWTAADASPWLSMLSVLVPVAVDALVGVIAGALVLGGVSLAKKLKPQTKS